MTERVRDKKTSRAAAWRSVGDRFQVVWAPEVCLALLAWAAWFSGHFDSLSGVAIPVWVATGALLGAVSPRLAVIVTVLVVPFAGGATTPGQGEVLRVIPVLAAAARTVVDRLAGREPATSPHWAVVMVGVVAAGLFLATAFTAALGRPYAEARVLDGLQWLTGAPVAFVATLLVTAHLRTDDDALLFSAILISSIAASVVALAAWMGQPWTQFFVFTVDIFGRLGALGYPTPTGIAIAGALPLALVAAKRIHILAGLATLTLAVGVIGLTGSRGPIVALGVGGLTAAVVTRRVSPVWVVAAGLAALVGVSMLVLTRYEGWSLDQILGEWLAPGGPDSVRAQSWAAAVGVVASNPLTGGGWRSLAQSPDPGLQAIAEVHNMVLSTFATGGLPLGLAVTGLVVYALRTMWLRRRFLSPFVIASAVTFLAAGLWDLPHARSYGAVIGGLSLGLVSRRYHSVPERVRRGPRRRRRTARGDV